MNKGSEMKYIEVEYCLHVNNLQLLARFCCGAEHYIDLRGGSMRLISGRRCLAVAVVSCVTACYLQYMTSLESSAECNVFNCFMNYLAGIREIYRQHPYPSHSASQSMHICTRPAIS